MAVKRAIVIFWAVIVSANTYADTPLQRGMTVGSLTELFEQKKPTKQTLQLLLGDSTNKFENDTIRTWRLRIENGELSPTQNWEDTSYSLVVVFDKDGNVIQHALVRTRK